MRGFAGAVAEGTIDLQRPGDLDEIVDVREAAGMLGISADLATEPLQPPSDESLAINDQNRNLVAPDFTVEEAQRRAEQEQPIEQVGAKLRSMMPFVDPVEIKQGE